MLSTSLGLKTYSLSMNLASFSAKISPFPAITATLAFMSCLTLEYLEFLGTGLRAFKMFLSKLA